MLKRSEGEWKAHHIRHVGWRSGHTHNIWVEEDFEDRVLKVKGEPVSLKKEAHTLVECISMPRKQTLILVSWVYIFCVAYILSRPHNYIAY